MQIGMKKYCDWKLGIKGISLKLSWLSSSGQLIIIIILIVNFSMA